ncbi:hypothetical protein RhiirC2_872081 [Rhizophagus irregularis]|uniref:Uncharacterized protein n=1 Tax=Rhizophagus irregularis TaxID=588596 RepID=A0A2N1M3L1_9GLOM|nr:hypothetical protein RhiirC2_872081 [Rhizophagus irregularis]
MEIKYIKDALLGQINILVEKVANLTKDNENLKEKVANLTKEHEKAEREKTEREKTEREKTEREKAEREKAEHEKNQSCFGLETQVELESGKIVQISELKTGDRVLSNIRNGEKVANLTKDNENLKEKVANLTKDNENLKEKVANLTKEHEKAEHEKAEREKAEHKKNQSCFGLETQVELESGKIIQMSELKTGDRVVSNIRNGIAEYSEIYLIAHIEKLEYEEKFAKVNYGLQLLIMSLMKIYQLYSPKIYVPEKQRYWYQMITIN